MFQEFVTPGADRGDLLRDLLKSLGISGIVGEVVRAAASFSETGERQEQLPRLCPLER